MTFHNRHECKFVVPETAAMRVLQRVAPFVVPDPNAADRPGHAYAIASLYLDAPGDRFRQETVDGRADRYKLRVRCYDDDADGTVFLEIKSRRDRVVLKERCPLPRRLLPAVLRADLSEVPVRKPRELHALHEFVRLMRLRRAEPRCTVRYDRQAYMGRGDDEVRVTVDRRLSAIAETGPIVRIHDARYRAVPVAGVVVELKFTDRCPPWLAETIRACELRRVSFSKYSTCAAALLDVRTASTG